MSNRLDVIGIGNAMVDALIPSTKEVIEKNQINRNSMNLIDEELKNNLHKYDVVIVNDYGHGLLTKKLINVICKKSKFLAVNVQINAGNQGYNLVTKYMGAEYYSLDMEEARRATQDKNMKPENVPKEILRLTKGKVVSENQVLTLMRYYELIKEIKNVHKS